MTHQLFDDLIGTPPPSRVDVDGIVRRKTGLLRLRRAAVAGGAAVAVLAVVAAVAVLPAGDDRNAPGLMEPSGLLGGGPAGPPSVTPAGPAAGPPSEVGFEDLTTWFDHAVRRAVPLRWAGDWPPDVTLPRGGDVVTSRVGLEAGGRKGTMIVTVWPRAVDAAAGCLSGGPRCVEFASTPVICGRVDTGAVRPALGVTRPGWELRCVVPGNGRAVSVLVTNQAGGPQDPLPQQALPIKLADMIPIVTVLARELAS